MSSRSVVNARTIPPGRTGIPRAVEAGIALLGLMLLSPLLGIVAMVVKASSRGPVLFRQERVGLNGAPFTMLKFRSMRSSSGGVRVTASGDPRITTVGRHLRRSKLDELPELWNVVRGDMSLVGPRPEVPGYVDLSNPVWKIVLSVRPGITDPVTLAFRDEESLIAAASEDPERYYLQTLQPHKLARYADYLSRRTFASDVSVLVDTLRVLVLGRSSARPDIAV